MGSAFLDDRGIVELVGQDARALLQRLITNDVAGLRPGQARYAALLTPQGKILVDFIVVDATPDGGTDRFLLDCPAGLAADLAKRLALYRLRAKLDIRDLSATSGVTVHWPDGPGIADPRHVGLGTRIVGARAETVSGTAERAAYDALRIALGVPEGGRDFAYGDAFPHDANLDRLGGVDFAKGCYVGQEVVSRVHHRGTARKRIVLVTFDGAAPAAGAEITAGGVTIGTMGSSVEGRGLATLRIDRAQEAAALGAPAVAGAVALAVSMP